MEHRPAGGGTARHCALRTPHVALALVCALASAGPVVAAEGAPVSRYGAKLVKADLADPGKAPEVRVLDDPEKWRVLHDEKHTGTNRREFYFTVEAEGKVPPPRVEVRWPGVGIARVLGAQDTPEKIEEGIRFRLHAGQAPTGVRTMLRYGLINLCIFHNWEVRRAGPYRAGPWPADAIQAQLNFLFAAREMCRAMGYEDTRDPGFEGDIRLYGFETNFPNGHDDSPPHFHIMLAWPGWLNTQVTHFRLDDRGRILTNDFQTDDGKRVTSRKYGPGEVCRMLDKNGKVGFELLTTPDATGVILRRAEGQPEFRLGPDTESGSAVTAVEVSRRDGPTGEWRRLCRVNATDAADRGEMRVAIRPEGQPERTEVIRYDPDTGLLSAQ